MTLRVGIYEDTKPIWKGVLREDGYPMYTCIHQHHAARADATKCAREAYAIIKKLQPGENLPHRMDTI